MDSIASWQWIPLPAFQLTGFSFNVYFVLYDLESVHCMLFRLHCSVI